MNVVKVMFEDNTSALYEVDEALAFEVVDLILRSRPEGHRVYFNADGSVYAETENFSLKLG